MTLQVRLHATVLAVPACLLMAAALTASPAVGATPPEELNFSDQKPFSRHTTHVSVDEVPVPGAEATEKATVVGSIANGNGDIAEVTLKGGKVSIEPVDVPGKYSGSVNLVPSQADGSLTKISFSVRDSWVWAAIFLGVGLLIALLSELWLTRWRPRGQLKKAFVRLGERLTATVARRTAYLGEVKQGWIAPRVEGPGSMLAQFKERIESGLTNATSDAERERFGPNGDEMKKVDTVLDTYEELLGYSGQVAQSYKRLDDRLKQESIRPEFVGGALVDRIRELLEGRIIAGAAELTETLAEAKDIYLVLHAMARLDLSFRLLAAKPDLSAEVKKEIAQRRKQLLCNAASTDDLTAQRAIYAEIAKKIYAPEVPKAVEATAPLLESFGLGGSSAPAPAVTAALQSVGIPLPAPAPVVSVGAEKEGTTWSKYFDMGNWAFTLISAIVVFLAGLSALYFTNATFGSVGDYLGVLLWGSTVQGGISLVRQVVPGASKGLTASS